MKYVLALLLFFIPEVSQAALVACSDNPMTCNWCSFVATINNLIQFIITVLVLCCVLIMMYAGFRMVTSGGDAGAAQEAKKLFTNVVIGFVIILAAWTIVDTLLKATLQDQSQIGKIWRPVDCGQMFQPVGLANNPYSNETAIDELVTYDAYGDPIGLVGSGAGVTADQAAALARLQAAGISLKEGASIVGIQSHVIDRVIALNNSCGCNVLITEGTGGSHANGTYSHSNGYKLDLRTHDNPALVDYVRSLPSGGSWSDGTRLYIDRGSCATYAVESDHIDVQYLPSC